MDHKPVCKTSKLKLLEENRGEHLCDLGLREDLLARTPKARAINKNLIKWTSKILKYPPFEENKKISMTQQTCQKIFTSHKSDKGLASEIYKEHSVLNNRKVNNSRTGKSCEQTLKEDMGMANIGRW